ncbi:MAG: DUF924 family protein [Acetobacteraceae bacterium]|jgi:uncharacterized protein (DUF924 family)|nr:DUF924 family protein [Acetobacteraceae bacterium]
MAETATSVVAFWREAGRERWFGKDEAFDALFRYRFMALHLEAAARQHDGWIAAPESALALVLLLDQFPRNAFRGTAHMFATDPLGLVFAEAAIARGHDRAVAEELRPFFYLPFMHAEDLGHQERCVALCQDLPGETLKYAIIHRDIIARFGRFPHRNPVFGRVTTAEEQAFLDEGGFSG